MLPVSNNSNLLSYITPKNLFLASGAVFSIAAGVLYKKGEDFGLSETTRLYTSAFTAAFGVVLLGAGFLLKKTSQPTPQINEPNSPARIPTDLIYLKSLFDGTPFPYQNLEHHSERIPTYLVKEDIETIFPKMKSSVERFYTADWKPGVLIKMNLIVSENTKALLKNAYNLDEDDFLSKKIPALLVLQHNNDKEFTSNVFKATAFGKVAPYFFNAHPIEFDFKTGLVSSNQQKGFDLLQTLLKEGKVTHQFYGLDWELA